MHRNTHTAPPLAHTHHRLAGVAAYIRMRKDDGYTACPCPPRGDTRGAAGEGLRNQEISAGPARPADTYESAAVSVLPQRLSECRRGCAVHRDEAFSIRNSAPEMETPSWAFYASGNRTTSEVRWQPLAVGGGGAGRGCPRCRMGRRRARVTPEMIEIHVMSRTHTRTHSQV